jgi:hypothetical protein
MIMPVLDNSMYVIITSAAVQTYYKETSNKPVEKGDAPVEKGDESNALAATW